MKTTVQTSRGPVRFHSVGEPIIGIQSQSPAAEARHTPTHNDVIFAVKKIKLYGGSTTRRHLETLENAHAALVTRVEELEAAPEKIHAGEVMADKPLGSWSHADVIQRHYVIARAALAKEDGK